ncbi:MAG: hypothetical protein AAGB26_11925 [Planctomycetota bacterium]
MAINIRERIGGVFRKNKSEVARRDENSREAVVNELRQGYNQLVETMHAVRGHMEDQSRRSDRVMQVIETLPEVLKTIPETARQQNETLIGLAKSLEAQNQSTAELTDALSGLAQATKQQEQALAGMHDRLNNTLARGEQSQQAMVSGIDQMSQAITGVTQDQKDGRAAIAQVAEQTRRQQKQMVAMNGVSWALAVLALGVASWVAVTLIQHGSTPIAGRDQPDPTAVASPAPETNEAQGEVAELPVEAEPTDDAIEANEGPAPGQDAEELPAEEELVTEEPAAEKPVTLPTPDPLELGEAPANNWSDSLGVASIGSFAKPTND